MSERSAVLDRRRKLGPADREDMLAVLYLLPYQPAGLTARKIAQALWPGQTRNHVARVRRILVKLWDDWGLFIEGARLAKRGNGRSCEVEYWIEEELSRDRAERHLADWPEAQEPAMPVLKGVRR